MVASRRQARRFRPGLDYTLATPGAPWEWKRSDAESGRRASGSDSGGGGSGGDAVEDGGAGVTEEGKAGAGTEREGGEEELMVLDAVLCFVDDREPYKEAAWRQDEVGGYVTYLGGDEEEGGEGDKTSRDGCGKENGDSRTGSSSSSSDKPNGAAADPAAVDGEAGGGAGDGADAHKNDAAVYKADEGGSLISVSAASNALSLVLRDDAGISSFVKYVSSAAPGSRYDVVGEYLVACSGGDDDEDAEDCSSSSEGSFGVPGGVLETVPEGESGEEEEEEMAGEERSRKKMKPSNGV